MIEKIQWAKDNFLNIVQIVTLLVVAAELITRLTPTKSDDGAVKRLGEQLDKLLTFLKVPNLRRQIKEGSDLNDINDGPDSQMVSGAGGTSGPGVSPRPKEPTGGG